MGVVHRPLTKIVVPIAPELSTETIVSSSPSISRSFWRTPLKRIFFPASTVRVSSEAVGGVLAMVIITLPVAALLTLPASSRAQAYSVISMGVPFGTAC